jgi:RNA polymerase sigma factor (sigma-70 family)
VNNEEGNQSMKDYGRRNYWERLRFFGSRTMGRFTNERNLWYEAPEEVEAGLERGAEKAELLRWVRAQAKRRLTARERQCLELYFFRGLTFRQASEKLKVSPSSVHRAVRRSLRKLRRAAELQGMLGASSKDEEGGEQP